VSVLSPQRIRQLLGDRDPATGIVITPLLEPERSLSAGTLDVRLGRHFIAFRKTRYLGVDPIKTVQQAAREAQSGADPGGDELRIRVARQVERITVPLGDKFVLHPYQLVLGSTLEYVSLPLTVAAYVLSRSSVGRLGILTATATYIHPGFRGVITLELVNTGETAVAVSPGMRVAQLVFEQAQRPTAESLSGRYQLSTRPDIARLTKDEDIATLARKVPYDDP
jgi:dCTP deaminase